MSLSEEQQRKIIFAIIEKYIIENPQLKINIYYRLDPKLYLPLTFKNSKHFLILNGQLVSFNYAIRNYFARMKGDSPDQNAYINLSFLFSEVSQIPEFNHQVLNYKNNFCRPINFFASSYLWHKNNDPLFNPTNPTLTPLVANPDIPNLPSLVSVYQIDYIQQAIRNEEIGSAGEQFVINLEKLRLKNANKENYSSMISKQPDGMGYDILSFEIEGQPRYIEVKTTTDDFHKEFFITTNEIDFMNRNKKNYFLYRVYNFDTTTEQGDFKIISDEGLDLLIFNPKVYSCKL